MERTNDGIRPCPFCGRWGYFVACACNAVGPSAGSRAEAIERWNERADVPVQGRLQI